ncbi:MAG TPA: AAA family ATPase [Solirubrobacteraceae bacterium]|nr:AAA family ATPase [Solirubrobacteraceae bacterium]
MTDPRSALRADDEQGGEVARPRGTWRASFLLVVGATADAGESEVAAVIPGAEVVELVAPAESTPLVAARHAGEEIDPAALVARAQNAASAGDGPGTDARRPREDDEPLVAAVAHGGLLAPLTPRYATRDLASELQAAVIVAAPARPGALNAARLTVEAARGGGLAVAALVLTGWPDPPSRVQLDERALLHELTGLPVLTLTPGAPPPDWDVADWVLGDAGAGPAAARVTLEPYTAWEGEAPGDPRHAPRPRLMDTLEEVVATEGPVLAARAYAVVNRAAGGRKLTSVARAPLSSAMYWLAKERRIALTAKDEIPWQDDDVARALDAPAVRVRELGPRELIEVPLDEVAELMRRRRPAHGEDPAALKRAVLGTYGLRRLTARADAYLETALALL